MHKAAQQLLSHFEAALESGADFPTIWNELLKSHPLVIGPPIQTVRDGRTQLEIRLVSGRCLMFDSTSKAVSFY